MSIKSIIFFMFLLGLIMYLYFNSYAIDIFHKYCSFFLLLVGIVAIFLYPISKKVYEGDSMESIKKYLVKKYKKKSKK